MIGRVSRLLGIERTVAALDIAVSFYRERLGFTGDTITDVWPPWRGLLDDEPMREACLQIGDEKIWLTEFADAGAPYPVDSRSNDLWFQHFAIVVPDIAVVYSALASDVEAISQGGPLLLPPNTGSVTAWKFRDPDRHPLELLQLPTNVGDAKWHHPVAGRKTLGIDHSAISVSDAEASIGFYRDVLGLSITSRGTNRGREQGSLDDLANDVVEVIALTPASQTTPHLELLAYQPPGRVPTEPAKPSDIAGDRLVFEVDKVVAILARMPASSIVANEKGKDDASALIRDPDGRLIILTNCRHS